MFALFFSLYYSMFRGTWTPIDSLNTIGSVMKIPLNAISQFLTSLFNNVNTPMTTLGDVLFGTTTADNGIIMQNWMSLTAFLLALITSISIVVMAVKGVKKAFGIFFGQIR